MLNKILITELKKNFDLQKELKDKINQIFYKFEHVYASFCWLTGALIMKKKECELFQIFNKEKDYFEGEEIILSEKEMMSLKIKKQYKKLLHNQFFIIKTLTEIKNNFHIFLDNSQNKKLLSKFQQSKFEIDFKIFNCIFSPSFTITINNCIDLLNKIFIKNKKIFYFLMKGNKVEEIVEKIFLQNNKNNKTFDYEGELIFKVFEDQKKFEEIILLIKYLNELSVNDLIVWMNKTVSHLQKS